MAVTGPAPWSGEFSVAMTCGALGAPGQKGQYPGCPCRSTSSPTMTQERVIGSLRNSMLSLGKQRQGTTVNRGQYQSRKVGAVRRSSNWDADCQNRRNCQNWKEQTKLRANAKSS